MSCSVVVCSGGQAHNPVPVFIREHREVLHRLHISPTGQRFARAWDVDVSPAALSAALEALTIACQLVRVLAINRRMRDPKFTLLDAPRGELRGFVALQRSAALKTRLTD